MYSLLIYGFFFSGIGFFIFSLLTKKEYGKDFRFSLLVPQHKQLCGKKSFSLLFQKQLLSLKKFIEDVKVFKEKKKEVYLNQIKKTIRKILFKERKTEKKKPNLSHLSE